MDLPFTRDEFFAVFEIYNRSIFPAQLLAYALGFLVVARLFKKAPTPFPLGAAVLCAFWLWTGLVYHFVYFSHINRAAYLFALMFVLQALLLARAGIWKRQLRFRLNKGLKMWVGLSLMAYALIVYPILGFASGHGYPQAPTFGLTPCPLTIFTFGLFLQVESRLPKILLVIPFLWSLIGFSAALLLGVAEDFGLLIAGLLGVGVMLFSGQKDRLCLKEQSLPEQPGVLKNREVV
jgi:hypothetical protein